MTYQANAVGSTPGIEGDTTINTANGVKATPTAGASAVYATVSGAGAALHGYASGGYDNSWAIYGSNVNTYGYGLYASATGNQGIGAYGFGWEAGLSGYATRA